MKDRCRNITPSGMQCRRPATRANQFCYQHFKFRRPAPEPKAEERMRVNIPLLEDRATLQIAVVEVMRALSAGRITAGEMRAFMVGFQVASANLALMEKERAGQAVVGHVTPEPVEEFEKQEGGEELGPETEYRGPHGQRKKVWSFDKILYNEHLKKQGKPEIEFEDDFPEEGYLTDEEQTAELKKMAEWVGPAHAHLLGPIDAVADEVLAARANAASRPEDPFIPFIGDPTSEDPDTGQPTGWCSMAQRADQTRWSARP